VAAEIQFFFPASVGQETEVTDPDETTGKDVE
jgi:hypothetical protein